MSAQEISYTYPPLHQDQGEIRLVKLMPLSASGDIEMEIFNIPSATAPAYEALSYVWGSPERKHRVVVKPSSDSFHELNPGTSAIDQVGLPSEQVQPSVLQTSRNLFIALHYLQYPKEPRTLWIDQLCINQEDIAERSEQVGKMGPIYSKASRVILWLGEKSVDGTLAIDFLGALGERVNVEYLGGGVSDVFTKSGTLAEQLENSPLATAERRLGWLAIKRLLKRAWFTRLWIIQEVALASNAVFKVGTAELPLPIFRAAIFWINTQYYALNTLSETINITALDQATSLLHCLSCPNLSRLLVLTRHTRCFDPRDRIYAILALLHPDASAGVVPNYSRAPEEIFKDAVINYINARGRLGILTLCRFHDPSSTLPLPSWVFDFSVPFQLNHGLCAADATGSSRQESTYNPSDNSLTIQGCQICAIDHIFEPMPLNAELRKILAICQAWEQASTPTTLHGKGVPWIDAFLSTIFSSPIADALLFNTILDIRELENLYKTACEQGFFRASGTEDLARATSQYAGRIQTFLPGRRLFTTDSGMVGLCPMWATKGDIVVVALGCESPLVLRPAGRDRYQVGGECYVHGMMNGEGLLGPLSPGSRHAWQDINGIPLPVFVDSKGTSTQLDPRAGPLPERWRVYYGRKESDPEIVGGKLRPQWFRNLETGEFVQQDPRLQSENLSNMGVNIQDFNLV